VELDRQRWYTNARDWRRGRTAKPSRQDVCVRFSQAEHHHGSALARGNLACLGHRGDRLSERLDPEQAKRVAGEIAMAGSPLYEPQSEGVGRRPLLTLARLVESLKVALWALAVSVPLETQAGVSVSSETSRVGMGVSSMSEAQSGSLLVEYFREFLGKRDVDQFRNRVAARYNEGTLGRILAGSPDVSARRAAVLSLGILGSFQQSNAVLGRALRDDDVAVRSMAEDALWAIWFRADTAEHNQILEQVRQSISHEQLDEAEKMVTRLIADAPNFAEAYNQRAFIYFLQGRFAESTLDCQEVLARNPFHIGAIEGMAKCQLSLSRPRDALKSLRRALKLRPHNSALLESINELEAQIESDGPR
jgi:tetratricopeptide (TPR) repeat protein